MTAIYEALRAEQTAEARARQADANRQQKMLDFIAVAEKFTDVCRLLTQGEQLLVAHAETNVAPDASSVELVHMFTDERGMQYVVRGEFEGDGLPPFDILLQGAADSVRAVASSAGLLDLEERLTF
ncbi:hypothetical protein SEA_ZARTROSA_55 [Arthrobacter phage Zartrosa]|uniref:Uncharacterized protein n=3 Tax=Marthavirus TaxID=1980936 RepID=A0A0U4K1I9_9CAUD|nr:hypothetical protein FDH50_gp54 [Arthrobacter phage Sonny]YP_009612508.1 hypothetical protein FDI42_gp55 [Arthrobacter phage Shade]YP_009884276.1 hypothetical protein HYP98_gp55 [Arthrobacter phage Zartrosa]ALY10322.1 hypothetical protein SONNY_54 [Arthrobacter phage Sonny]ASR80760.1 hypothetical protein SEA_SHADE_55 [Arthrobacter phage Shade]QED11167.1 hypothetical protein SEA_ZARTROSA_55 [Arthrobacter phage Zartrosa]